MQQRIIPKTGASLPVLGYGCMRFHTNAGRIDIPKAKEQVRYAIDHGVTYLDTAWPYHRMTSEKFLGDHVLTDGYREKVQIATKLPCFLIKRAEQFDSFLDKQRKNLGVEVIDYYLLHALNGGTFRNMVALGILEWLDRIKAEGKVRNVGVSFHDRNEEFPPICDAYDWDFCQIQFNILDQDFQAGLMGVRYAAQKGMGVFIMEPLRGGTLVNRLPKEVEDLYQNAPFKRSPSDWAMRWVLDHEEVTMVLSGMNELEHITANIETATTALSGCLTPEEKSIVQDVRDTFNRLLTVKCTACKYCMPCPAGIDIPAAFKALNDVNMFGQTFPRLLHIRTAAVQTRDGKPHWTTTCLNCGKCETACPQAIPIRESFKLVKKELEGPMAHTLAFGMNLFTKVKPKT